MRLLWSTIKNAWKLFQMIGFKQAIGNVYYNIGTLYLEEARPKLAIEYGNGALEISEELGFPEYIKRSAKLLSDAYAEEDQDELSLSMYKLFITMRDSINNINTQRASIEKDLEYEYQKQEALTQAAHENEIALSEAKKKQQSLVLWSILVGLILVVLFAIFIVSRLKITQRQKKIIEEKNHENELLLGEIHHRVKNNLQIISSLLSLQEKSLDDEPAKQAILAGKERVKSMGLIHKMLYQNDNYSGIEMQEYVKNLLDGLLDSFGIQKNTVHTNLDIDQMRLDVNTAIPIGLIINELIVNTFKYAYQQTDALQLGLKLHLKTDSILLEVKDNGSGKVDTIENSTSFGYKLVRSLVRQINGNLSIEDSDGLSYSISIKDFKIVS